MRAGIARVAALSAVSAALAVVLVACFDLFHSTGDIRTGCELDAQAPACQPEAVDDATAPIDQAALADAGLDFCVWSPQEALANAQHACAWLGACETPMGRNAFGPCVFQALLAYDCTANPNHAIRGKARDLWACLSQVHTCRDVDACIFPLAPQRCGEPGDYTACGSAGGASTASNADVRFECLEGGVPNVGGENCALWGQTCATGPTGASCAGAGGLDCTSKECAGASRTELVWCVDGSDVGIDCATNGGQSCEGFPDPSDASWLACLAEGDAGACEPDASASCANGAAWSCPSGVLETIDCAEILQSEDACSAGPLSPRFDWTSPCVVASSSCVEGCTDGGLTGCARGGSFPLSCATQGLGPCHMVSTDLQSAQHPACGAPAL